MDYRAPHAHHTADKSIGDYALIGDCRTAALVSRDGSIDWLCLPDFSSPSLFAALLDPVRGGHFAIRPTEPFHVERSYLEESATLETTFFTRSGVVRLLDLLPLPAGRDHLEPHREVLRLLEGLAGRVELELWFEPRPDFGRAPFVVQRLGALGVACVYGNDHALLATDAGEIHHSATHAQLRFRLHAHERRAVSLSFASHAPAIIPALGEAPWQRADATLQRWQRWSQQCSYQGDHRNAVVHSLVILKLLTHALSGAVIAAPTTSLPEYAGGSRNWDYRYCWLRDAARTLEAFDYMGYRLEAQSFLDWLLHATRLTQPELQVVYSVHGEARIPEERIGTLAGYARSRPIRIGNNAWNQLQLDIYGEVIDGAYRYVKSGGTLDRWEKRYLVGYGDVVCRRWREPDNGIWEIRGERRHYTHSKIMCWVVLDRLLKLHESGVVRVRESLFRRERDAIRRAVEERGFNRQLNSYVGVFDSDWLDAALLLIPHHDYLRGDHPRMLATYHRLRERLTDGDRFYRYPPRSDGVDEPEGTFGACSFWAVDCLAHAGRIDEAEAQFEHLLSLANDVGLYGEEFAADGTPLGNFPQAFTHAALVTAAIAMKRASEARTP